MAFFRTTIVILVMFNGIIASIAGNVTIVPITKPYNLHESASADYAVAKVDCSIPGTTDTCLCNLMKTSPPGGPFDVFKKPTDTDFQVYYIHKAPLDYTNTPGWHVTVYCENNINAADNAQEIYEIDVLPNQPPAIDKAPADSANPVDVLTVQAGTEVYKMTSKDVDGGLTRYNLISDSSNGVFSLDTASGSVTVSRDLRTVVTPPVVFKVTASDGMDTSPEFTLTIPLTNPNTAPSIDSLPASIHIPEDTAGGYQLHRLIVKDVQGDPVTTTCTVSPTSEANKILFDPKALTLKLASTTNRKPVLDYDAGARQILVTCQATDGYLTSKKEMLTIDVTNVNEPPEFLQNVYYCKMQETPEFDKTRFISCNPGVKVQDVDSDPVTVSLKAGVGNGNNFRYDYQTDQLTFAVYYDVDNGRNFPTRPTLVLEAIDDKGAKGTAQIQVEVTDVNDKTCSFGRNHIMSFNAHQATKLGTLGRFTVTDGDLTSPNNDVTIEEVSGDIQYLRVFSTGEIQYVKIIPQSDHGSTFFLTVRCKDKGSNPLSATATVALTYLTTTAKPTTTTTTTTKPKQATTTKKDDDDDDIWDDERFQALFVALVTLIGFAIVTALFFLLKYLCGACPGSCTSSGDCCTSKPNPRQVEPYQEYTSSGYREPAKNYSDFAWKNGDGFETGDIVGTSRQVRIGNKQSLPAVAGV